MQNREEAQSRDQWAEEKAGVFFNQEVSNIWEDYNILWTILGSPYLWQLPCVFKDDI